MLIKDLEKKREYQRLWVAQKRSRQNVEPPNNNFVEPLKRGWTLVKCPYCPQKTPMEKKNTPYFAPICSNVCLRKAQKEDERLAE